MQKLKRPYTIMLQPCRQPYAIFFDDASHHFTNDCGAILGLRVASGRNGVGNKNQSYLKKMIFCEKKINFIKWMISNQVFKYKHFFSKKNTCATQVALPQ